MTINVRAGSSAGIGVSVVVEWSSMGLSLGTLVRNSCGYRADVADNGVGGFLGHEMAGFGKRLGSDVAGNQPDHFSDLVPEPLHAAYGDNGDGYLGDRQRFRLLDAGEGGSVDAEGAEHAFPPREG